VVTEYACFVTFDRVYLLVHPVGAIKVGIASGDSRVRGHVGRGYRVVTEWRDLSHDRAVAADLLTEIPHLGCSFGDLKIDLNVDIGRACVTEGAVRTQQRRDEPAEQDEAGLRAGVVHDTDQGELRCGTSFGGPGRVVGGSLRHHLSDVLCGFFSAHPGVA